MPPKYRIKDYLPNSYYHIYNRGVEKRRIFLTDQDYGVFLGYLKEYLSPKDIGSLQQIVANPSANSKEKGKALRALRLNNFYKEVYLNAYCLKPNHFHFLIRQKEAKTINTFMKSLCTRYTMYINKKCKRIGHLFQDIYKAVTVSSDEQLLQLSKYIHKQSFTFKGNKRIVHPSSYPEYLRIRKTDWVYSEEILNYFPKTDGGLNYETFVEGEQDFSLIDNLVLEC